MNRIVSIDYKDLLPTIEDNSIDLVCTDPPYEINYQNLAWDGVNLNWDFLYEQFYRILKPDGALIIFQGWSNIMQLLNQFNTVKGEKFILQNWIIWDRIKGRGAKYNFTSTREDILWFTKSDEYTFNKEYSNIPKVTSGMAFRNEEKNRSLSNVWYDISPIVPWSQEHTDHPTQKPLQLIKRIIRIFSNENNLVLDCFCGSGTTGVACEQLNRQYIISDNNEDYLDIAKERIQKEQMQKRLF